MWVGIVGRELKTSAHVLLGDIRDPGPLVPTLDTRASVSRRRTPILENIDRNKLLNISELQQLLHRFRTILVPCSALRQRRRETEVNCRLLRKMSRPGSALCPPVAIQFPLRCDIYSIFPNMRYAGADPGSGTTSRGGAQSIFGTKYSTR